MKFRDCCIILFLVLLLGGGCAEIRPVWKGSVKLDHYTLYYAEPLEFTIDVKELWAEKPLMLELALTYYVGMTRTNLPLFLVIEDPEHNLKEETVQIVLQESGEWLGYPEENEIDYTITHIAMKGLKLKSGQHTFRIYANDDDEEKIYGLVRVEARLFEFDNAPETGP
ncbi:MAG: hypothetical protein AAFV07_11965 [Bacteroidota bacterium]